MQAVYEGKLRELREKLEEVRSDGEVVEKRFQVTARIVRFCLGLWDDDLSKRKSGPLVVACGRFTGSLGSPPKQNEGLARPNG